jgi:hypothetical protein
MPAAMVGMNITLVGPQSYLLYMSRSLVLGIFLFRRQIPVRPIHLLLAQLRFPQNRLKLRLYLYAHCLR